MQRVSRHTDKRSSIPATHSFIFAESAGTRGAQGKRSNPDVIEGLMLKSKRAERRLGAVDAFDRQVMREDESLTCW